MTERAGRSIEVPISRRVGTVAVHVVLAAGGVIMVGPFLWELLTSFKTFAESIKVPPTFLPQHFSWDSYHSLFASVPFGKQMLNTTIFTAARVLGELVTCSAAGFVFARMQFFGRDILFGVYLSIMMVPSQIYLLPQYRIIQSLGLLDTIPGLVIPGIVNAFGTFLMRQFFLKLPKELDEAARLDGANPFQIFWRVMLPLTGPGLMALTLITAIWCWNDLLWPLIVTTSPEKMTLSVGLASLQGQHQTDYPVLMAGALVASLPMIVMFIVFQRQVLLGMTLSGTNR